jgi:hypothetical protein
MQAMPLVLPCYYEWNYQEVAGEVGLGRDHVQSLQVVTDVEKREEVAKPQCSNKHELHMHGYPRRLQKQISKSLKKLHSDTLHLVC